MPCDTAGLGYSPFARRYWGNRYYFLFLQVLRCFSSLRSPPRIARMSGSLPTGCPIRTSAGHGAFATRRSFSQLVTSFFASESLGIPHAPFRFRYVLLLPCGRIVSELSSTSVFSPFDLLVKLLLCFYSCLPRFSLSAESFQICHCAPFCGGE